MGTEKSYQVEKKVAVDLVRKIVKEVKGVHSIKRGLFGHHIRIKDTPEGTDVSIGLIAKRGSSVPALVEEIQGKLKQEMERTLGTALRKIDIVIKGIR